MQKGLERVGREGREGEGWDSGIFSSSIKVTVV